MQDLANIIISFFLLSQQTVGQSVRWKAKAAHWNTGRLYISRDYGYDVLLFGSVCRGTGRDMIHGANGKIFGETLCKEMGFGNLEFIGTSKDYYIKFPKFKKLDKGLMVHKIT